MNQLQIFSYWPTTIQRSFSRWLHKRLENHYLICADVERRIAREAQANEAYYQRKAAFARSHQG